MDAINGRHQWTPSITTLMTNKWIPLMPTLMMKLLHICHIVQYIISMHSFALYQIN
jgi:hypothetical protein